MLVSAAEHHPAIRALGRASNHPEDFGCDLLFYLRGTTSTSRPRRFGIQRKELKDFVASVHDGRLQREVHMMVGLEQGLLVIEGLPRWTLDGDLMLGGYAQQWTRQSHMGILWSIQDRGIWISQTNEIEETAMVCQMFEAWAKKEKHRALDQRPGPANAYGTPTNRDFQRHLIQGLQGFGPELADTILDTVGMPFGMCVSDEELLKVPGLGVKKLAKMKKAFDGTK